MASPNWQELSRYSACDVADALLKLGVPGAGFLRDIAPIKAIDYQIDTKTVVAPASTFLMAPKATPSFPNPVSLLDDFPESNLAEAGPYADLAEPDTIVIISQPPGQSCAVMGGIMAARMERLGAKGIVIDGRVRDLVALSEIPLPIWSKGTSIIGAGAETKLHAKDVAVRVGEAVVEPGDIVMIDPLEKGVVAVPKDKVGEVLDLLPKLVSADEKVMWDVRSDVSVKEAFRRHRNT